jgi:small subunit ribosomal protein S9
MADDRTPADEPTPERPEETPAAEEQAAEQPAAEEQAQQPAAEGDEEIVDENVEVVASDAIPGEEAVVDAVEEEPGVFEAEEADEVEGEVVERVKPEIPGADLEVDIVAEGADPLAREEELTAEEAAQAAEEEEQDKPIAAVTIDLAAGARYRATGKRKTAVARVTLKPGTGAYTINGKPLDVFFPRTTLQRNIRQPLEAVGYEERMDVIARMHGGGVSAQAGALRHGISRALLEADPNLRGELKRRGFLTRDARAKERKKAGLKKARKRPQFSKR